MVRIACALLMSMLALTARAEEQDVLARLMSEPVTLFDWGMVRLDRDMAHAAMNTLPRPVGSGESRTGSIYDWRSRRVTMYASVELPAEQRTRGACLNAYRQIVAALTAGAPVGRDAAGWYLLNAFTPKGHFWGGRFEDIGRKLLDMVQLEISFIPESHKALGGDTKRVRCAGRLDAEPDEIATEVTS